MTPSSSLLGTLLLFAAALAPAAGAAAGDEDLRDVVLLRDGKEVRGRILQRYDEQELVLVQDGRTVEIPRQDVSLIAHDTRASLRTFLDERRTGLTLDQEWALVARADQLGLPRLGDLQAWHVLTLDPRHTGANERLGHRLRGGVWQWRLDGRWLEPEEFEERMTDWGKRLVLHGENWRLETNTTIRIAVDTLFDLERAWTHWMDTLGAELKATEVVVEPAYGMKVLVFKDQEDPAYSRWIGSEREPFYGASLEYRTQDGEPNAIFTHVGSNPYPLKLMELAGQQLLYTTLRYGRRSGDAPEVEQARHAYWAEIGAGYWMTRVMGGTPGYARPVPFRDAPSVLRAAQQPAPRGSALANPDKELPNLINLPFRQYHSTDEDRVSILRAKAMTFFTFLLVENPDVVHRGEVTGSGRDALLNYLREVYATPRGHSSSAFDEAIAPGEIEDLQEPWHRFLHGG